MNNALAIAGVSIKELYRRKDFYVLFVLSALITLMAGSATFFHDSKIVGYIKDLCLLLIWVSSLVIAVTTAARQIPAEREQRTIFPLLAKPITRCELIFGKFLGCWFATGIALVVFYLFLGVVSASRDHSWPVLHYFQAIWMQWMMLGIVIAMSILGSIVFAAPSSNSTIIIVVVLAILVLGAHLHKLALGMAQPTQSIVTGIYFAMPHLEFFDLRELVVYKVGLKPWWLVGVDSGYAVVYMIFFLYAAWALFPAQSVEHMRTLPRPVYVLALLFAVTFTLATCLEPLSVNQTRASRSQNLLGVVMGDAQKLFAGLFFRKADVYFHSGYYPSMFDQAHTNQMHIAEAAGGDEHEEHAGHEHEEEGMDFLKPPLDWIEALGRHSINTRHSHLDETGNKEDIGEMLPWLRMSAELDPQNVTTYTVGSFYLRQMGKSSEAEEFLRDGLRENPESFEIQYELARIYSDERNDPQRAINLLELALKNWQKNEAPKEDADNMIFGKILAHLSLLEEKAGDYANALAHMEMWKSKAPAPESVQKQIDELKARTSK